MSGQIGHHMVQQRSYMPVPGTLFSRLTSSLEFRVCIYEAFWPSCMIGGAQCKESVCVYTDESVGSIGW